MKILLYIKKYKIATLVITILLVLQSISSFIIPNYTSKIIDVGIQQGGIEYATPTILSEKTYQIVEGLSNNVDIMKKSYDWNEVNKYWTLNNYDQKNLENLSQELEIPLSYCYDNNFNVDSSSYNDYINNIKQDILKQKSINAAKKEMLNNGVDINSIQIDYLIKQGAIMLIITLLFIIIVFVTNTLVTIVSSKVATEKRKQIFDSIMNFKSKDINHFGEWTLITRCSNDVQNAQSFCEILLRIILYAPISIIVGLYFTITTAIQLSWILVIASIGIVVAAILFRNFVIKYFRKTQKLLDTVNGNIVEILTGIYINRTFNKQDYTEKKFDEENKQLYKYQLITGNVNAIIIPTLGLASSLLSILIIFLGGFYVNSGLIQVGGIIAFSSYTSIVIGAFTELGRFIGKLPQASVTYKRIESVINHHNSESKEAKTQLDIKKVLKPNDNAITFKNVSFSYDDSNNYSVKNINFEIKQGQTIGIVGEVGSGKTTILELLLNMLEPSKGEILLNNTNIKYVNDKQYKNLFAYSPQQSILFSGNVKNNVAYGIKSKSEKEIQKKTIEAIKISQASDFIKVNNPNGLNKRISQDGNNVSGGQKQRLSIARALASNNPVILLDDSFSALDYNVESRLKKEIFNKYANNTKIIVSSRISSIINSDKILVIEDGKIIEEGNHEQLMKHCQAYLKIAKAQLDDYEESKKWNK